MFVLEGEVEMTIEKESTMLRAGDVVVVNRGLHHKLYSEGGVTFMEALAPVPLDHVPDHRLTSCSARTAVRRTWRNRRDRCHSGFKRRACSNAG